MHNVFIIAQSHTQPHHILSLTSSHPVIVLIGPGREEAVTDDSGQES